MSEFLVVILTSLGEPPFPGSRRLPMGLSQLERCLKGSRLSWVWFGAIVHLQGWRMPPMGLGLGGSNPSSPSPKLKSPNFF